MQRSTLPKTVLTSLGLALLLVVVALSSGCNRLGPLAKSLADKEVYPIVDEKQQAVFGESRPYSIESTTDTLTQSVIERAGFAESSDTTGGLRISLAETLALAVNNSPVYQNRTEDIYLTALDLTLERHEFDPIFSGAVTGRLDRQGDATGAVERFGTATGDLGVDLLLATGARISVGLATSFVRFYTDPQSDVASGALSASIIQPLLRGAGTRVTLENLIQAERDVIYEIRSFARFQKAFVVDRVIEYYRLLQSLDEIENEFNSLERLTVARERAEALEAAGRLSAFQVDQARQDEIRARNRWINAQTNYVNQLNDFKVNLGLPTDLNIQPDPAELSQLASRGLVELGYNESVAERIALQQRYDYLTALDQVSDASRRIHIAENSLLPVLDAQLDADLQDEGTNQPLDFDWEARDYGGQLSLELPLDRKAERNAYRRSLIALERRQREARLLRNEILAQVRQAWANVEEARLSYEIQLDSLELARQRVKSVQLLLQAGRSGVNIRDQLEAEAALRDAQNALTRVLVDFTIARLQFYNAIEQLEVDTEGMWSEKGLEQESQTDES